MYLDCHLYRSLECLSLSKGYRFNHLLIQGILQFDWLKAFSAMSQQGLGDSAMISAGVSGICGGRWCIAGAFISSGVISGGGLQSVAGYLGLALVLGWGGGGGSLVAVFWGSFTSAGGIFILPGGCALGYHSVGFRHFPNIS